MSAPSIIARFDVRRAGFMLQADLELPGHGITVLFGPSGAGKSTLLRAIAGLERHPGGYLEMNGMIWQDDAKKMFVPTHERGVGYVFQEPSLFAHLSVRRNLEYGQRRADASGRKVDMAHAVELLGIGHLLDRDPGSLSGGERQRVAIARALAGAPALLLMDEPLAALDARLRKEILPYLERLHDELAMPLIYVTHSAEELARLADHVVLLDAGKVTASGALADILARLDLPNALAEDAGMVVQGTVTSIDAGYDLMQVEFPGGSIQAAHQAQLPGARLRIRILARDVALTLTRQRDTSILNQLEATVIDEVPADAPAHVLIRLDVGGTALLARITRKSRDQLSIAAGKRVWAQVKAVAVVAGER